MRKTNDEKSIIDIVIKISDKVLILNDKLTSDVFWLIND